MQQDIGLGSSPIGRNDEGGGTKMCFNNRGFRPAVYTNEIMPPDRFLVDVTPATTGCGVKPAAQPVSFGKVGAIVC